MSVASPANGALLRAADAELYAAKQARRNQLMAREFEGARPDPLLTLKA